MPKPKKTLPAQRRTSQNRPQPARRIHAYRDTGKSLTISNGTTQIVANEGQFGYVTQHQGTLTGWGDPAPTPPTIPPMRLARTNYVFGQVLGTDDFFAEQNYFLNKMRLHHLLFHGCGIVSGLEITVGSGESPVVKIAPGYAIDSTGNLICVTTPHQGVLMPKPDQITSAIFLKYMETYVDPVPVANPSRCEETAMQPTRILDGFRLYFEGYEPQETAPPPGREPDTIKPQPLAIGRLRLSHTGWALDPGFTPLRCH